MALVAFTALRDARTSEKLKLSNGPSATGRNNKSKRSGVCSLDEAGLMLPADIGTRSVSTMLAPTRPGAISSAWSTISGQTQAADRDLRRRCCQTGRVAPRTAVTRHGKGKQSAEPGRAAGRASYRQSQHHRGPEEAVHLRQRQWGIRFDQEPNWKQHWLKEPAGARPGATRKARPIGSTMLPATTTGRSWSLPGAPACGSRNAC